MEHTLTQAEVASASAQAASLGLGMPRFETRPALHLAGLEKNYNPGERATIPMQWQAYMKIRHSLPAISMVDYGVVIATGWDCRFIYMTGCSVGEGFQPSPGSALVIKKIVETDYVIFAFEDHVARLAEFIDRLWAQWAPLSGLNFSNAPFLECYTEAFDPQVGMNGIEVWLPFISVRQGH